MNEHPRGDSSATVTMVSVNSNSQGNRKGKGIDAVLASLLIFVAATVPVHRFITSEISSKYTYLVLGIFLVCALGGRLRRPFAAPMWGIALIAIPFVAAIAGFSSSISASLRVGIALALLLGLTPFVLRYFVLQVRWFVRWAVGAFMVVQAASAAAGLFQATGLSILGSSARSGRVNGLTEHPNVLGLMCAVAIVVCVPMIARRHGRVRFLSVLALGVNAAALLATGSLSSMIALSCGLLIALVALRLTAKSIAIIVASLCVAIPLAIVLGYDPMSAANVVSDRIDVVTGETAGVASLDIRLQTYHFALQYIAKQPVFGVGMDAMHQGTFNGITVVHDYLLRAWYQGGLPYFVIVAALTIVLASLVARCCWRRMNAAPAAVVAVVLIFAATSAFFDQQQYWLPVLLAVALVDPSVIARKPPIHDVEPTRIDP